MTLNKKSKRNSIDGFIPANRKQNPFQSSDSTKLPGDATGSPGGITARRIDDFRAGSADLDLSRAGNNQNRVFKKPDDEDKYEDEYQPSSNRSLKQRLLNRWQKDQPGSWSKAKKKTRNKRMTYAFLSVFIIGLGFLTAKGYVDLLKAFSGGGGAAALNLDVDPEQLNTEGDGRVNILLLGRGGPGHVGPDLTDTIILLSIDPVEKSAGLVSVPRDLYVTVPEYGSMKINSVFYNGKTRALSDAGEINDATKRQAEEAGLKLVDDTVKDVLGIPINYHGVIDFSGFKKAIDTVEGIDIDVPKNVREQMLIDGQPYLLDVSAGQKHFEGFEALSYSRSRHTSARGDFDRTERQRQVIIGLKEKVLSLGTFSNPTKLSQLLEQFGKNVSTNFSLDDTNKIYSLLKDINSDKIKSIGLSDPPRNFLKTDRIDGSSVVLPLLGQDNYQDIHHYIRNSLRDSFMKQEDAGVVILNGTKQASLAKDKAKELRSLGYKVTRINNAPPANYQKTVLVDMALRDNKYTKNYLQKRLQTVAVNSLPDGKIQVGTNDFVIILGSDAAF